MSNLHETPVTDVPGIGEKRGQALFQAFRIRTVQDLLYFYPRRYADRRKECPVRRLREGEKALVTGKVVRSYIKGGGSKERLVAVLRDDYGDKVEGVWFRGQKGIQKALGRMDQVGFFGEPERYGKRMSISHPEFFDLENEGDHLEFGRIVPFYHHSGLLKDEGLSQTVLRKAIYAVFEETAGKNLPVYLPAHVEKEEGLIDGAQALRAVHFPESDEELNRAVRRIKFEELFFIQLLMTRERLRRQNAPALGDGTRSNLTQEFLQELPFSLTGDQEESLEEIITDISQDYQMNRLLQGDVGAGKTVVAVSAMLEAASAGYQTAFMAPTSVLAEQHYQTVSGYLNPLGIDPVLLTGDLSDGELQSRRGRIEEGAPVAVGTHAIIQDDTTFEKLGLAIIDEQHRFGVEQRRDMFKMGTRPHKLLMTATPIPRSLAMGLYGDLDVSAIEEMPDGRKPVDTRWIDENNIDEVYDFIRGELEYEYQAFVVCPLKAPSSNSFLRDVSTVASELSDEMPTASIETVHGSDPEKDQKMQRFANGEIDILVSTTVIEVGVDVPNATAIIIREADEFGLSQLHQLRGRVGRSDIQSFCMLVTDGFVTDKAYQRLMAMTDTNDGFEIAEQDLRIRGVGDFLGTRQSGIPGTHLANVQEDSDLMEEARRASISFCEEDVSLSKHPEIQDVLARRFGGEEAELAQVG